MLPMLVRGVAIHDVGWRLTRVLRGLLATYRHMAVLGRRVRIEDLIRINVHRRITNQDTTPIYDKDGNRFDSAERPYAPSTHQARFAAPNSNSSGVNGSKLGRGSGYGIKPHVRW